MSEKEMIEKKPRTARRFSPEQKRDILWLKENGTRVEAIKKKHNIPEEIWAEWEKFDVFSNPTWAETASGTKLSEETCQVIRDFVLAHPEMTVTEVAFKLNSFKGTIKGVVMRGAGVPCRETGWTFERASRRLRKVVAGELLEYDLLTEAEKEVWEKEHPGEEISISPEPEQLSLPLEVSEEKPVEEGPVEEKPSGTEEEEEIQLFVDVEFDYGKLLPQVRKTNKLLADILVVMKSGRDLMGAMYNQLTELRKDLFEAELVSVENSSTR